eukprot:gene27624-30124_t
MHAPVGSNMRCTFLSCRVRGARSYNRAERSLRSPGNHYDVGPPSNGRVAPGTATAEVVEEGGRCARPCGSMIIRGIPCGSYCGVSCGTTLHARATQEGGGTAVHMHKPAHWKVAGVLTGTFLGAWLCGATYMVTQALQLVDPVLWPE